MESEQVHEEDCIASKPNSSKKRKKLGRLVEVKKKLLVQSHELGPDCHCTRLKCFDVIDLAARKDLISKFNNMKDYNEQNLYLGGLVNCNTVKRRRPRLDNPDYHNYSYSYKVRTMKDGVLVEVPVCYKAFVSLHGITTRRVQTIQTMLTSKGQVVKDSRGSHNIRPHKLSDETVNNINCHIQSLRGRKSHYSLHDTKRLYLPDTLNVHKLCEMYNEMYPNNKVSDSSYRAIFQNNYNIGFGYPRADTCSKCDESRVSLEQLRNKLKNLNQSSADSVASINAEIRSLEIEQELHLRKSQTFYSRKKQARLYAQKLRTFEALCIDFQKNLSSPNITTNDIYYKRQLSYYLFNIHCLSTQDVYFFAYDQTIGGKGSNEVVSMLYEYLFHYLDPAVKDVVIFCDSCAGQNKNYTLIRFLYHVVHYAERLDSMQVVFPIRGHSYMECDRDMGLINQKTQVEIRTEWADVIRHSRVKPSPFNVVECEHEQFRDWSTFLGPKFQKTCPFPTRPVRELKIQKSEPKLISHRENFNGEWIKTLVTPKPHRTAKKGVDKKSKLDKTIEATALLPGEFEHPDQLYSGPIPVSIAKLRDLQSLKKFLSENGKAFYSSITTSETIQDE